MKKATALAKQFAPFEFLLQYFLLLDGIRRAILTPQLGLRMVLLIH